MAQLKHPNPNFTINSVKGWNTRLLYTYYAKTGSLFNILTNYDVTDNVFYVIEDYSSNNSLILSKGQYNFPANSRFFKSGKSIRIKGYFFISCDANAQFNIRASIENISNSNIYNIAATNNFNNHFFSNSENKEKVPVSFEIVYGSIENGGDLYMCANGFYEYDYYNYNSAGTNLENVYVPIWSSSQYVSVGTTVDEYKLYISFDNSVYLTEMYIRSITVEELT